MMSQIDFYEGYSTTAYQMIVQLIKLNSHPTDLSHPHPTVWQKIAKNTNAMNVGHFRPIHVKKIGISGSLTVHAILKF